MNTSQNRWVAGVRVIQTGVWRKRVIAFEEGRTRYHKFKNDSAFSAGLVLYWAEGTKGHGAEVTNSDQSIIVFMVNWFNKYWGIKTENFVIQLHIHSGQNEGNMQKYWSRVTGSHSRIFARHT